MNRNAMILTLALTLAVLLVPPGLSEDSSGAEIDVKDINLWICYGRHIVIEDHNYDRDKYTHIEWRYSRDKAELDTIDPVEVVVLEFDVPFEVCPDDSMIQYYVRETAILVGEGEKSEDLTVLINPSSFVRYVDFMYNDGTDTVYMHAPITSDRCYKFGDEYLVPSPLVDPIRPGYKFGGWYEDSSCTTGYTKYTYKIFDSSHVERLYAKWTPDPSSYPGMEMVKIYLNPVDGLRFAYDGLVIPKGTDFSYTVSIMKKYSYDLSNASSLCVDDSRSLNKSDVRYDQGKVSSCKFTLPVVEIDSTIILTGVERQFFIYEDCHGVRVATGYENPTNKPLNVKMEVVPGSGFNSIDTSVWMGGVNVTGNVVDGNWINIERVTGDVYIFSYGKSVSSDFPWWILAVAAAAVLLLLVLFFLLRKKGTLVLSSSGTSFDPLPSEKVEDKELQCVRISMDGMEPAYVFLRKGKDYLRVGYAFRSEDLPEFLTLTADGTISLSQGAVISSEATGRFTIAVTEYGSDKVIRQDEFGYIVKG